MTGVFPVSFFYPNWINDFWRIQGLIHFYDPHHFEVAGAKRFDRQLITRFCADKGLAFFDTASKVCRLKGNASDEFLLIIKPAPIADMLQTMPRCNTIVTTGGKSSDEFLSILKTLESDGRASAQGIDAPPAPSSKTQITIDGRQIEWWRMPSTSRAYPMSLQSKAAAYRQLFPSS